MSGTLILDQIQIGQDTQHLDRNIVLSSEQDGRVSFKNGAVGYTIRVLMDIDNKGQMRTLLPTIAHNDRLRPVYHCRAYASIQNNTVVSSGNISSVIDHGDNTYSFNYSNELPENYTISAQNVVTKGKSSVNVSTSNNDINIAVFC